MLEQYFTLEEETVNDFVLESEYRRSLHETERDEREMFEANLQFDLEEFVTDLSNATRLNYYYGTKLGWNQYYNAINRLLLPFSGLKDVSLGAEAFALALAEWQRKQGFSEAESDGILGPHTWAVMQPLVKTKNYVEIPGVREPGAPSSPAPPVTDIPAFNQWHAAQIADAIDKNSLGTAFDSLTQLRNLANGQRVKSIDPKTQVVAILPIIYHIMQNAKNENFTDIIIGSFLRDPTNGSCTGHCAGRSIDINCKTSNNFENSAAHKMVANILRYLLTLPIEYKKKLGFGMPFQGQFFPKSNLKKFSSVSPSLLISPELRVLVPQLGFVFPDNDNHLHIQVGWY